jgi:transcriptional regulator with PAS, ATPase and Fis domain
MSPNVSTTAVSLEQALRHALDGVFLLDRNRHFVLFNEACERITGYGSADLVGDECYCCDTLKCEDEHGRPLSSTWCPVKPLFEGTTAFARQRMRIRRKDGAHLWVETVYTPVRNGAGEVEYVLAVMRDVTDVKAKEDDLLRELSRLRQSLGQAAPGQESQMSCGEPLGPIQADLAAAPPGGVAPQGLGSASTGAGPEGESLLLDSILARVEREAIRRALRAANWQRNKAAKLMGISRSRLYRRMEALGIDPNEHL